MKKNKITIMIILLLVAMLLLTACKGKKPSKGQIYLYGEAHAVDKILDLELYTWGKYYEEENMRHLFVEHSYFTGELLNLWMESDNDEIFDLLYKNWAGSLSQNYNVKRFYKTIKEKYPETIFHATDIGHQYESTGTYYLDYLVENKLIESEEYRLALESIEQGREFYESRDDNYREEKMTENFIREYEKLGEENIMGIYGAYHTKLGQIIYNSKTDSSSEYNMATRLEDKYGDRIQVKDFSYLVRDIEAIRSEKIEVMGREYEASYFGIIDMSSVKGYTYGEFWRLENAYNDFKKMKKSNEVLPYDNYPMLIKEKEVFLIDYHKTDGQVDRVYHRSDGTLWQGQVVTEAFILD